MSWFDFGDFDDWGGGVGDALGAINPIWGVAWDVGTAIGNAFGGSSGPRYTPPPPAAPRTRYTPRPKIPERPPTFTGSPIAYQGRFVSPVVPRPGTIVPAGKLSVFDHSTGRRLIITPPRPAPKPKAPAPKPPAPAPRPPVLPAGSGNVTFLPAEPLIYNGKTYYRVLPKTGQAPAPAGKAHAIDPDTGKRALVPLPKPKAPEPEPPPEVEPFEPGPDDVLPAFAPAPVVPPAVARVLPRLIPSIPRFSPRLGPGFGFSNPSGPAPRTEDVSRVRPPIFLGEESGAATGTAPEPAPEPAPAGDGAGEATTKTDECPPPEPCCVPCCPPAAPPAPARPRAPRRLRPIYQISLKELCEMSMFRGTGVVVPGAPGASRSGGGGRRAGSRSGGRARRRASPGRAAPARRRRAAAPARPRTRAAAPARRRRAAGTPSPAQRAARQRFAMRAKRGDFRRKARR